MMEQVAVDDSERGQNQHVDNIIVAPEMKTTVDPVYRSKGRGAYLMSFVHKHKLYIGIGIAVIIFIISVVLGVSLSGDGSSKAAASGTGGGSTNNMGGNNGNGGGGQPFDNVPNFPNGNGDGNAVVSGSGNGFGGSGNNNNGGGSSGSAVESFQNLLEDKFAQLGYPTRHYSTLSTAGSAQLSALEWLTESDNFDSLSVFRKLQRYALASFFYATYAVSHPYMTNELPWKSEDDWLSEEHECDWEGIACDDDGESVTAIELNDHRLSGTIPLDLGLLGESLVTLHVSSNFLYMDGEDLDVFVFLINLQDLKMDDNYIVGRSGLPTQLQGLENLEKLTLSYNLLQGTIPADYFTNLQKLSHLEVESNYIAGSLPHSLLNLDSLVYLYMRRNSLQFSLSHLLQRVNWPKIFSLWLDNNMISGPIPTEIGLLTGLASLSITNATLQGPLPAEIGNLAGLRRMWFYANQLTGELPPELDNLKLLEVAELHANNFTGSMPIGVCSTIEKSTYRFKELSVDCDEVVCTDCCTKCP